MNTTVNTTKNTRRTSSKHYRTKSIIVIVLVVTLLFLLFFWNAKQGFNYPTGKATAGTRVHLSSIEISANCTIPLYQGKNLISIGCANKNNNTIINRIESIRNNLSSIHMYDPLNLTDHWKVFAQDLPSYVVFDLDTHDYTKGFWIFMKNASTLSVNGTIDSPAIVPVYKGYTLIGFPINKTYNVSVALDSIDGTYNHVVMYNASKNSFENYDVLGDKNFTVMNQQYGYWINTSSNASIILV